MGQILVRQASRPAQRGKASAGPSEAEHARWSALRLARNHDAQASHARPLSRPLHAAEPDTALRYHDCDAGRVNDFETTGFRI